MSRAEARKERGPLEGLQILVVEDHEDSRDLFRLMLEYLGALVLAVATVDEAVVQSRRVRVDVILTDVGLRPKPGTWFVEDGRQVQTLARAPIVAVTGRDLAPSLHRMFEGVVQKPVDAQQLCDVILQAVHRRP